MDLSQIAQALDARKAWMVSALEKLVLIESPTEDRAAVNRAMAFAAELAGELGAHVEVYPQTGFGDFHAFHCGPEQAAEPPVLVLGHLDTVWPIGTLAAMPWREENGRLYGPGVLDMKAGVVMALAALDALRELGLERPVTLLLNSEEEVGSPVSRAITERLALAASAVFVLEPAQGLAYKTARKGVGEYTLQVEGVAAHSGVDFTQGHSAIVEMAGLIQTVSDFTDLSRGRTVNCGVVHGGTRSNVVAGFATAHVDVRIAQADDAARVEQFFHELEVNDPACRLTVTGGINRPPMERSSGTVALFHQAQTLAAELGFALEEAATGGGSDGNFTAALGVPTLDGMGAVGDGAHAAHESVLLEHLVPRATLLAAMLAAQ